MQFFALFLIVVAGVMQASYVVPIKVTTKWEWENTWLMFSFLGFIVVPGILVLVTVPQMGEVLRTAGTRSVFLPALFGLGWGCGSVCFGLSVKKLGVGLATSIVLGVSSSLGSLVPWFTSSARPLGYSLLLWCGVLVMLAGVVVCSKAGQERDKRLRLEAVGPANEREFKIGLFLCIASGILSSFINLGFVYGAVVTRRAEALGANKANASNLLWLIIMVSGFLSIATYCGYLLLSKRSWRKYRQATARYCGWALVMALLWVGSLVAYGVGANKMGSFGPSVGWPILSSLSIITSNAWGVATGEWRGAGSRAKGVMACGIGILLVAVGVFAWASATV